MKIGERGCILAEKGSKRGIKGTRKMYMQSRDESWGFQSLLRDILVAETRETKSLRRGRKRARKLLSRGDKGDLRPSDLADHDARR